jgi:hypothetical protein
MNFKMQKLFGEYHLDISEKFIMKKFSIKVLNIPETRKKKVQLREGFGRK